MLNSLLSISTRSILCPLHIHVLTVTTTVRTLPIGSPISYRQHLPLGTLPTPSTSGTSHKTHNHYIFHKGATHATSYGSFFAEIPSISDLRPMHMFTTSVSPRDEGKKRKKTKSIKNHKTFSEFYSLADFVWFRVADLFTVFIYLFILFVYYLVPRR